jgi:hypothetical protein
MGLGFLLPLTAIVTTVILVAVTDARAGSKAAAVAVCVASFLVPRLVHELWWLAPLLQLGLSISIIVFLKYRGYTR